MPKVGQHKAITGKCRLCGVKHSRSAHKSHGKGSFKRTHRPEGLPTERAIYEALLDQGADSRVQEIRDMFRHGDTELTGKVHRVSAPGSGGSLAHAESVGRFKGGWMKAFPELAPFERAGYTPGRIASSIESARRTGLQRDIWRAARAEVAADQGEDILAFMEAHPVEAADAAGAVPF